mgnify:CR=1 FL=1
MQGAGMKEIAPAELAESLTQSVAPTLLDVRLADDHEAAHLPGAISNAVFEVAFHERLTESLTDKDQAVVIYGASGESQEAAMAFEKLERAGYSDLLVLEGGIEAWTDAGHALERGTPLPEEAPLPDGSHELDLNECRLEWLGRNLLNKHHGTIEITSGHLDFDQGQLYGGEIVFDLNSLKCADLDGSPGHDILIKHLMDHDFLDVSEHPECRLTIQSTESLPVATPGSPNLRIRADLTLRGVTEMIEFTAATGITPEGKAAAQASFSIDRTRWGIIYGSSRYFHRLAGHLVNDLIEFQARIVTR